MHAEHHGRGGTPVGRRAAVRAQMKRDVPTKEKKKKGDLPSPTWAALASALAFAVGGLVPLLVGGFVKQGDARVAAVCAATNVGLAGFGASGGATMARSGFMVLVGGWLAMAVMYSVLWLFVKEFPPVSTYPASRFCPGATKNITY